MPLIDSLNNYRAAIVEANSFVSIAFRRNRSRQYVLAANEREFITDSAFLRAFINWETFLERTFVQYMLGEQSFQGRAITRHVQPLDERHANDILIGTQKYVDWANPEIVRKFATLFFGPGNPFETFVGAINQDLLDLRTIRNAAAHLSSTTQPKLNAVGTRILGRPTGSPGIKVSTLLFSTHPASADTVLSRYLNILDVAAEGITNG